MDKFQKKEADITGQELVGALNRGVLRDNIVFDDFIRKALRFSIKTHEVYQKQKRKGKDIAYITHPLTVGLILSKAGAPDHIIAAGILHDTIEDSIPEKKVTYEMIAERFGSSVADIVLDVTEENKELPWKERKLEALNHIKTIESPSLWVKTADTICNIAELLDDYKKDKDEVFERFNAPEPKKENTIANHKAVLSELIKRWERNFSESEENPLVLDLEALVYDIKNLE